MEDFKGILLIIFFSITCFSKEISLSFDDAPLGDGLYFSGTQRTQHLIKELKAAGVERAAFYVNTSRIYGERELERLKAYKSNGHLIGNHTHSHLNLKYSSIEDYLKDLDQADSILSELNLLDKYFRFPFLRRGKNKEEVESIRNHIVEKGYVDAFVTVDNFDFYMNKLFQDALKGKKNVDMDRLRTFYVDTLIQGVEFYEKLGNKVYKTPVRHVLLLHENDLAALFIKDLVNALKSKGWKIISPERAYSDPKTKVYPQNTLNHGQGRIVAHAVESNIPGPYRSGLENTKTLDEMFKKYNVLTVE